MTEETTTITPEDNPVNYTKEPVIEITLPNGVTIKGPYDVVKQYMPHVPKYNYDGTETITATTTWTGGEAK